MISNRNWMSPKGLQHDEIKDQAKRAVCAIALEAQIKKDETPRLRIRVGGKA